MATIISVVNQKGGVAKTTTAINLAAALGELGQRVLLVDLDPQGNATTGLGIQKRNLKYTVYDVLMEQIRPKDAVLKTDYENLWLIPSTQAFAEAEVRLLQFQKKNLQLKKALLQIKHEYDIILVDCLPSLGVIALNGLAACDSIIVPMQCEPYSLEGVAELLKTVTRMRNAANPKLSLMGIVFTMLDKRLTVSREVIQSIKAKFPPNSVFETVIPRNVRIAESPSHGMPVIYYDPGSKGAEAYRELAKEVYEKCKQPAMST